MSKASCENVACHVHKYTVNDVKSVTCLPHKSYNNISMCRQLPGSYHLPGCDVHACLTDYMIMPCLSIVV